MANKARDTSGKFAPKSETPRKIRCVNLTDETWKWLGDVATQSGVSRNDYLEAMAEGGTPFIEMVYSEALPLMETVQTEVYALREELGVARTNTPQLQREVANSAEVDALREQLIEAQSQLTTERADRKEIEAQLSELKQNSVPAATLSQKLTPDAATMLSKLRAKRKKSKVELADVEALLELLDES